MVQSVFSESLQMMKNLGAVCGAPEQWVPLRGTSTAGAVGCQDPHAVQLGEMESPAAGQEQTQAPVYAGGHPAGKQLGLGRKGHQLEHEPAVCTCGMEGSWYPGLR